MPSTATSRLRLEKQAPGENNNSWGTHLNDGVIDLVDFAIAGAAAFTLSGSKTLSTNNYAADEARAAILNVTGGSGGTITIPNVSKAYLLRNGSSGNVVVTTGSGTSVTIAAGQITSVFCDGSNVVAALQTLNTQMKAISDLTSAADKLAYFTGAGTAALADFTAAGRALVDDASATAQVATLGLARGFSFYCGGVPDASEIIFQWIAPYAMTLSQANTIVKAQTAATASTTLTLRNGASSIGTFVFGVGGTTATITISTPAVAAGDVITITAPASQDATLANFGGTIKE